MQDGAYPRITGQTLHSSPPQQLVSVVGEMKSFDSGSGILTMQSSDGVQLQFSVGNVVNFQFSEGQKFEGIAFIGDGPVHDVFVVRPFSPEFDMETYNLMLGKVWQNPKYKDLF